MPFREPGKWRADVRENEIVARGYDHIADVYLEWTTGSPLRERWLNELSNILPLRGDVLDLGCGAGIPVARRLTEMGFSVLGIDGSSRQIALACKNEPHAEFRLADMVSVSFPIASFAAITAFYSITHVRRAEHAAISMCRIMYCAATVISACCPHERRRADSV